MGIQINGQTDTVTSTTAGGSVTVTPLAASSGLNVGTGASVSSPTTNVLTLGTNNSERIRINSSGNTGIGTNNPTSRLHVYNGDISITAPTNTNANLYLFNNAAISNAFRIGQGWSGNDNIGFLLNVANADMVLGTNNTERARITGVGSFGIGTNDPKSLLHLEGSDGLAQIRLQRASTNIYGIIRQSSAPYGITYDAVDVNTGAPTHTFRTSADGSTFSSRVTIDSSGRLLIGATSSPATAPRLVVQSNPNSSTGQANVYLQRGDNTYTADTVLGAITFTDSSANIFSTIEGQIDAAGGSADYPGRIVFKTVADGGTNPVERLRIDSSGNFTLGGSGTRSVDIGTSNKALRRVYSDVFVHRDGTGGAVTGNTAEVISYGSEITVLHDNVTLSTNSAFHRLCGSRPTDILRMRNNGGGAAITSEAGGITGASDYRIKENVTPIIEAISAVKSLNPVKYTIKKSWNPDATEIPEHGFIAHEVAESIPNIRGIVYGEKDAVNEDDGGINAQSIDYARLTPILCAALKECIEKIETLEAEVAELKSKVI